MEIPANYQPLDGSIRRLVTGAHSSGAADPNEPLSLSICLRGRPGAPPLPSQKHWGNTPPAKRQYLSREDLSAQHGAVQDDLDRVAAFLKGQGFTDIETSAARRLVKASGTVEMAQKAFAVELRYYELDEPRQRYRSYEGAVYIPTEFAGIITGVFGLDNRVVARRHYNGPPPGVVSTTSPREVAALYGFPLDPRASNAKGETAAVLEFNSYFLIFNETSGFQQSDIDSFISNLAGGIAPQVVGVSIDNEPIQMVGAGALGDPSVEVALDIEVIAAVAQGAGVVAYFAPNTEQGWVDAVSYIVADTVNNPSVLSISWGQAEDQVWSGLPQQLTLYFQMAAAIGMTVFASSGDTGSMSNAPNQGAQVAYPASDPWVTGCGGTTITDIQAPLGMTFKELTWNDSWGATGGGISTIFPKPTWQGGVNLPLPVNLDPTTFYGRGVPDIAGNASPFSGYYLWVYGQQTGPVGGTSAVAPLYAALAAIVNSKLGYRVGFLNPTLYALGNSGVFNDINDGANNEYFGYPGLYYTTGPGWDACTGWGSVNGRALLSALKGGQAINQVDSTPMTPAAGVLYGMLYLFWKANDPSNRIYYSGSADGLQWPSGALWDTIDSTPEPLAACAYNNDIYLYWKANDPSNSIYYSSFLFPNSQKINNTDSTPLGLAACFQGASNSVYLFWKANDPSDTIYYSSTGDFYVPWPAGMQAGFASVVRGKLEFVKRATAFAPAAVIAPNGDVVLFWTDDGGSGEIFTADAGQDPSTSDGWVSIGPGTNSQSGPAACLFNGNLYVFWTSNNTIFYSVSKNGTWAAPVEA